MPLSENLGIQALVQSYDTKAVDQAMRALAAKIGSTVDDVNDRLNKISIDKDVLDNLVKQLKALPDDLKRKTQGMSFDLFENLINADGAEAEIDKAFKMFSQKMESFNKLRNSIGNDSIIIRTDFSELDAAIDKLNQISRLQNEVNGAKSGKKKLNSEIKSLQSQVDLWVQNRSSVEKYNIEISEVENKIKELGNNKNLLDGGYVTDKTINNVKELLGYLERYIQYGNKLSDVRNIDFNIPLSTLRSIYNGDDSIFGSSRLKEEAQNFVSTLKKYLQPIQGTGMGTGGNLIDEKKLKEQKEEIDKLKKSLSQTESQLSQVNQKYEEQNKLVSELESKLKSLEGINNPKVIETNEYKNLVSELESAKNEATKFRNELDQTKHTIEYLQNSIESYKTGDIVPAQDLKNADNYISSLIGKLEQLQNSLNETEQKLSSLSNEVNNLQQDNTSLKEQLVQQEAINKASQERINQLKKEQEELQKVKREQAELLEQIKKLRDLQSQAQSVIEGQDDINAFKAAQKNVEYNEGKNTPAGWVNFDYLEKAKEKLKEVGNEQENLIKAAVYYNQYLQKGGTEKIFNAKGEDVSDNLIKTYNDMLSLIEKTDNMSQETALKVLRGVNKEILARTEEIEALNKKSKALERHIALLEKENKLKGQISQSNEEPYDNGQTVHRSGTMSREDFVKFSQERQRKQQSGKNKTPKSSKTSTSQQEPQVNQSSTTSEQQSLEKLEQAINSVTAALAQKVKATQEGEVQTDLSVNQEIAKLQELEDKLTELKTKFKNGLSLNVDSTNIDAKEALKNHDGVITNPEIDVNLKPTVDADKFKSDAERLLAFVDVDKKVDLEVGEIKENKSSSNKNLKNNIYSSLSDDIIKSYNIKEKEVKNKIRELVKSLYDNIDVTGSSEKYGDNFASTFDELGKVVVDNANIIQQKTGIYEEFFNYIKGLSSIKIPDVVRTDLGDDWDVLRKTYASKFSTTKGIELDSIYQEMESQFKDLFSGTSDQAEQFKEIINNIRAYRKDINKTVPLSDDNIDEIYSELLNRIKEMRDKIKVELGNSVNDKDNLKNEMQIQPLINNQEWIDAIDDILKLIGTRKVPIVPDTESNEWKEFSNFVNEISNKVIQLKINEDNRKQYSSTNLPPELNDSYKNSTKYTNELYKIEEEIYKVKEKVNRKDSESLSVLEEKKKKYEDLLNAEKQFREQEQFKDFDTSTRDNQLNKLISTKQLELEANKNIISSQLQEKINQDWDNAFKENENFDNGQTIVKVNDLLDQQQKKYQEIWNIKVKISTLDPIDNENDILLLNQQKSSLESELNIVEDQLNAYDDLIDKKKQSKELDFIERNGNFDINENTSNRVKELDNAIYSNLKQQSDLELKNLSTTGLTADEQSKLNDLKNEYVVLTEKANKALTEEYGKLTSIDKVLNHIKDMQGLGINGVGRVNDVDVAENEGLSINNALNQTSQQMNELRNLGQTDLFGQIFQQAESEVNELNNRLINSDITLTEYNKNIKSIQSTLSKQTNAVAFFDPGDMEGAMQTMRSLALQIPGIQQDTLKWSNNNRTLTATLQTQNGEWKKVIFNAQAAGKTINQTFNNINPPVSSFSKFIDDLGSKFHNLTTYVLSFVGAYEIWSAIQQGFTYVRELDSALTEMRKVSDETVESLREFQEVSFDVADAIGSTAKQIQNSTADFMRLGYSLQEASQLAEDANIYANVGDMEIDEATEHMISSIKAWGSEFENEVEASEAIIDRYNEINFLSLCA